VADAYYSKYPFIPGGTNTWKLVLLYLNADAEKDVHLIEENGFRPVDNSHFLSISRFTDLAVPEDFHFISSVTLPNGLELSTSTYITAAFYDWEMRYGAYAGFHLVAVDKQRYYFQDSAPSSAAPSPPSDISFSFDDFHSALGVNWPQAMDPDTADTALSYEFNYSTSTEFRPDKWQNVGRNTNSGMNVVLGNDYLVGVRAKDDFGNISDPIIRSWNDFPAGYQLLPFQPGGDHPIGTLDGNGQKILISQDSQITRASLWMSGGGGQYSIGASYLAVASDDNGAIGSIIATSSSVTSQYGIQNEVIYNFSAPVYLASGNYWLVPVYAGWGGNTVYGTNDAYPDGYWSGNPSADAYFFIR